MKNILSSLFHINFLFKAYRNRIWCIAVLCSLSLLLFTSTLYAITPQTSPIPTTTFTPTTTATATTTVSATPTPQPPTVTTGEATVVGGEYDCLVTLNGTVNAGGLQTTAWFEYGETSGSYSDITATHTISGTSDTTVSNEIVVSSTRCWTKTYYYRLVAQNNADISYGNENSFSSCENLTYEECGTCFVSGYVTDAISGKGIENASILIDGVIETVTDETGYYDYDYNNYIDDYGLEVTALANGYIASIGYFSCSRDKCHDCRTELFFELQPVSSTCSANSIIVSSDNLILNKKKSSEVTVTVKGENDCLVDSETVTATINKAGKKHISILPSSAATDSNGAAKFTITAKRVGTARVIFKAGSLKKSIIVRVRR